MKTPLSGNAQRGFFCKSGEKHFSSCIDWLCLQGAVNTGNERDLRSKSMSKAKPYECFFVFG